MRKFISYAFVVAMILSCGSVGAQDYAFRVLANKGTNQVKKAGAGQAEVLKTGAKLSSGDEIIASDDAYIGLMHKSGKTTEIRGAGTKKVSELEKNINTGSSSIASRYASFVMNKMNEEENTNNRSRLNATGAVSRATGSAAINVMAPSQADLLGDLAILRWDAPEGFTEDDSYVVKIENIFNEEIYSEETKKTSVALDFSDEDLAYDMGLYLVKIYKKGDDEIASGEVGIKKVKSGDKVEVQENLANLKSEVSDDSPLNKIIYASFYEENGLILDALTKYEEAIKMSPDIDDFQELYQNFLIKNGLAE
ncbi:hypothetical protein [Marinoscillum sp. 108]|uniref:hypothetical protein n=1 Tax=Marinoscillum sp. 108 TaxID=2653151 RepID=UPI001357E339|nr:hypothetical protein [Marinoscillum sp. 108]